MKTLRFAALLLALVAVAPALPTRAQPPHAAPVPPPTPSDEEAPLVLDLKSDANIAPGKPARVQIGIKNRGSNPVTLKTVTVGDKTRVDTLSGKVIAPGATVRWKGDADVRMPPGMQYGPGLIKLSVESDAGLLEYLRDVRRLEPLEVKAEYDSSPVFGGAEFKNGDLRSLRVSLKSRAAGQNEAKVEIALPSGWGLADGKASDTRQLREGEQKRITYKIFIPIAAPVGEYPVVVTVTFQGRTYTQNLTIAVTN